MAQFVGQQNDKQGQGERETCGKGSGFLVEKSEGADELVEIDGLVVRIRDAELCASDKTGAEREKEQNTCKQEGLQGRPARNGNVLHFADRESAPVNVNGDGWRRVFRERSGHEMFAQRKVISTDQYSTDIRICASRMREEVYLVGMRDTLRRPAYPAFFSSSMP